MAGKVTAMPRLVTQRVNVVHTQFSDAGVGPKTITLLALPAKAQLVGAIMITTTSPDDGAGPMASYAISVGDTGDVDSFVTATNTFGLAANTITDARGVRLTTTQGMLSFTAAVNVTATATADVNLNTATSGAWTFEISYVQYY